MKQSRAIGFGLVVAVYALAALRYQPPRPAGIDTPASGFSALRAQFALRAIVGDGSPRDVGSPGNARARAFVVSELTRLGFTVEEPTYLSCTRHGQCATTHNIVATRNGRNASAKSIALMAHIDSVAAGPGASDDAAGVAACLEVARALANDPPLHRAVQIAITDGEEGGILGASALAHDESLMGTLGGLVNIDARGSSGPAAMFETSPSNAKLIERFARHANHPVTSSLFYEVYRRMPNDTDFSALKNQIPGFNFANIGGIANYHTPRDAIENVDLGTLQHHGEQALAMIRSMADETGSFDAKSDAVWFDVMAWRVILWPASRSTWLAIISLMLVVFRAARERAFGIELTATFLGLASALVAAFATGVLLRKIGALEVPWLAYPAPAIAAIIAACVFAFDRVVSLFDRRFHEARHWAGTWIVWGVAAVVTAFVIPGASFLFIVPTLVASVCVWAKWPAVSLIPLAVAAVLWAPVSLLAYDGLGLSVPIVTALPFAMIATTLPRAKRRRRIRLAALWALLVFAAWQAPAFSGFSPQRVNVVFQQESSSDGSAPQARVFVDASWGSLPWGTPPKAMVQALGDASNVQLARIRPGTPLAPSIDVEPIALPPPAIAAISKQTTLRHQLVEARLRSVRGARTVGLMLPESRSSTVHVEGQLATPKDRTLIIRGVGESGITLTIEFEGSEGLPISVFDVTPGIISEQDAEVAARVAGARGQSQTPSQEGDFTMTIHHLKI